jgi:hypothetical protein
MFQRIQLGLGSIPKCWIVLTDQPRLDPCLPSVGAIEDISSCRVHASPKRRCQLRPCPKLTVALPSLREESTDFRIWWQSGRRSGQPPTLTNDR